MREVKIVLKEKLREELKTNLSADYFISAKEGNSTFFEFYEKRKEKPDRIVCIINADNVLFIG